MLANLCTRAANLFRPKETSVPNADILLSPLQECISSFTNRLLLLLEIPGRFRFEAFTGNGPTITYRATDRETGLVLISKITSTICGESIEVSVISHTSVADVEIPLIEAPDGDNIRKLGMAICYGYMSKVINHGNNKVSDTSIADFVGHIDGLCEMLDKHEESLVSKSALQAQERA